MPPQGRGRLNDPDQTEQAWPGLGHPNEFFSSVLLGMMVAWWYLANHPRIDRVPLGVPYSRRDSAHTVTMKEIVPMRIPKRKASSG
jgi:hypothetical protein